MYICICNRVTEKRIKELFEAGLTLKQVRESTGLGTVCGTCINYLTCSPDSVYSKYREEIERHEPI